MISDKEDITQKLIQECFIDSNHRYGFGFIARPRNKDCACGTPQKVDIKKVGDKIRIAKSWYMASDLVKLANAFYGMDLISEPDIVSLVAETEMMNDRTENTKTIFLKSFKHNPLTKETKNTFYGLVSPII